MAIGNSPESEVYSPESSVGSYSILSLELRAFRLKTLDSGRETDFETSLISRRNTCAE
jgi:hypothetical protein